MTLRILNSLKTGYVDTGGRHNGHKARRIKMESAKVIDERNAYREFYKKVSDLLQSGADGDYLHDELWEIYDEFDTSVLEA